MSQRASPDADVVLRDIEDSDLEALYAHQRDPRTGAMAGVPSREREAFLQHWAKVRANPNGVAKAIVAGGRVAGHIGGWEDSGQWLVGYVIDPERWGQGIATAALREFLRILEKRPLYAHVVAHNVASMRVLEKCGFVRVGSGPPHGSDEIVWVLG